MKNMITVLVLAFLVGAVVYNQYQFSRYKQTAETVIQHKDSIIAVQQETIKALTIEQNRISTAYIEQKAGTTIDTVKWLLKSQPQLNN